MKKPRCEARVVVGGIHTEHGMRLPDEYKPCTFQPQFMVTRKFSDITQSLCEVHAQRFRKDRYGMFTVTEIVKAGA